MNFTRIFLAALGAFVAYFILGGVMFGLLPTLKNEFMKYPAVYRSQEGIKSTMPFGMFAMFIAMLVLAILYAMLYHGGSGVAEGARFGALSAVFAICSFVIHNYVNLNIGVKLTVQQCVAYFVEWLAVGIVIGLITGLPYRVDDARGHAQQFDAPAGARTRKNFRLSDEFAGQVGRESEANRESYPRYPGQSDCESDSADCREHCFPTQRVLLQPRCASVQLNRHL